MNLCDDAYRAVREVLGHILVHFFHAFTWLTSPAKAAKAQCPDSGSETKRGVAGTETRAGVAGDVYP